VGHRSGLRSNVNGAEITLEWIAGRQAEALRIIQANGFRFEEIGNEPGNWQHLAFALYTILCEIDSRTRCALDELREDAAEYA
jgi:hypothetical protein